MECGGLVVYVLIPALELMDFAVRAFLGMG